MKKNTLEKESLSKSKVSSPKTKSKNSIYANANSYSHFLSVPCTGHNFVKWAFGLRSHPSSHSTKTIPAPPQTFYKTIQARKFKHTSADFPQKTNVSQFQHLSLHRKGNFGSSGLLTYETSLRYDGDSKQLKEKEKKWCSLPKRQRLEVPKSIKSTSLRKTLLGKQDFEASSSKNSKFTQKIINTRNFGSLTHMIKKNVNLPSIAWQANLRSY